MTNQSFSNHIRFYAPHHFIFYPIMTATFCVAAYKTYFAATTDGQMLWGLIAVVILAVIYLSFMMRQHYALLLQDRIIRQEMRYRYFVLTGNRFEPIEIRISDSQLFALRFCPDNELEALVTRVLNENLSPTKIKKAINIWKADYHRV